MKRIHAAFLLCFASPLYCDIAGPLSERMNAHYVVGDFVSAVREIERALDGAGDDTALLKLATEVYARAGDEVKMLATWQKWQKVAPEAVVDDAFAETMAWGILAKASHGPTPQARLWSVMGSAASGGTPAVDRLLIAMEDPNGMVRASAVRFAARFPDNRIKKKIRKIAESDRVWWIRLEAIRAIGALHMVSEKGWLLERIGDPKQSSEERVTAMIAYVDLCETIEPEQLHSFITSSRAGLRMLACRAVRVLPLPDRAEALLPLLQDTNGEVRIAALLAVMEGTLSAPTLATHMQEGITDSDPLYALTAAYGLLRLDPAAGEAALLKGVNSSVPSVALYASALLAQSGSKGADSMERALAIATDPFIRLNLALGLIGQRRALDQATAAVVALLGQTEPLTLHQEASGLSFIGPASAWARSFGGDPEAINQACRFEIATRLAYIAPAQAQEVIKQFLSQRTSALSSMASSLLIQEGDSEALTIVRGLLADPDLRVRAQAALVLAFWGRDGAAVKTLTQLYPDADHALKEQILEALGSVNDKSVLPFLVERFNEKHLLLRLIAASSIIQLVNG